MKGRLKQVLFILLILPVLPAEGQKILTLTKPGIINRVGYYNNSEITFKLDGEHIRHTGFITNLNDSSFLLNNLFPVKVADIRMILDFKKGRWARFCHRLLLSGGILYFTAGTANRLIFKDSPSSTEPKFLLTCAALIGGSFIFSPFAVRKYRINKYRYLKVLDVNIGSS